MGLMNKKIAPKKPMKKIAPKPIKKQMVEKPVEQIKEQLEQPMVQQIQETEEIENIETKNDVNDDEKNDFIGGENLENENFSEIENNDDKIPELENNKESLPVKELKTVSETEEVETKKSKKKTNQKKNKIDNLSEKITDIKEAEKYLSDIINFTSEEWEKEKEELSDRMKTLTIHATLNPDELKKLLSDMSDAYTTIKERLVDVERAHKSLQKQIKDVRTMNTIGSNATERNLNAQKAVMFFKKNKDDKKSVDLEQYDLVQQDKIDFYRSCIDIMSYNRQLLITFASAFKIEINNY